MPRSHHLVITALTSLAVMTLLLSTGCLRTGDAVPLDNEDLQTLSATNGKRCAYPPFFGQALDKPDHYRVWEITDEQLKGLVEALRPIISVKVADLPPDAVSYVLDFQPGKNPIVLRVNLADDRLIFAERTYRYEGGDPKAFRRIADAIIAANPGRQRVIVGVGESDHHTP